MIRITDKRVLFEQRRGNPFGARSTKRKGSIWLELDPARSKLGAGLIKGLQTIPEPNDKILYLGASAGYTVSFLAQHSDIIFAVEVSPLMARELILAGQQTGHVAPILASARQPEEYMHRVLMASYLFCDISQPDQVNIFIRNVDLLLEPGGFALLSLKTRSINAVTEPDDIFKNTLELLSQRYTVIEHHILDPYQKDHYLIAIQK